MTIRWAIRENGQGTAEHERATAGFGRHLDANGRASATARSTAKASRLEQFLADNPAARRWYIDYVDLHDELLANQFGGVQDEAGFPHGRSRARNKSAGKMTARRSPASVLAAGEPRPSPGAQGRATLLSGGSVPAVASPSFILHPSAFLDSPLLSYLVAILVFVGGIVGAWAWRLPDAGKTQTGAAGQVLTVNSREVTAPGATGNSPREAGIPPPGTVVGRIMAAVDCRWADPALAGTDGAAVALGRKYALDSGILEIRYLSGPDVILQGPADYEVDSDRGGRLLRGKLTARVEPRWDRNEDFASLVQLNFGTGQGGLGVLAADQKSGMADKAATPVSNPQSPVPNPQFPIRSPCFTVRTSAAVVSAGLGTEFGMEAEPLQVAKAHVFQGHVALRLAGVEDAAASEIPVGAGQLARVGLVGSLPAVSVLRGGAMPESFARRVFLNATAQAVGRRSVCHGPMAQGNRRGRGRSAGCRRRRRAE